MTKRQCHPLTNLSRPANTRLPKVINPFITNASMINFNLHNGHKITFELTNDDEKGIKIIVCHVSDYHHTIEKIDIDIFKKLVKGEFPIIAAYCTKSSDREFINTHLTLRFLKQRNYIGFGFGRDTVNSNYQWLAISKQQEQALVRWLEKFN